MKLNRVVIYPKDIERMTGKGDRYSRKVMCMLKKKLGKRMHQFVTVYEYAEYSGIPVEVIEGFVAEG